MAFSWEQRKVGEVSKRVIVGLATSVTPYYRAEGIPIFRNLNIKENHLDDTDILFLERSYAEGQVSKQIHTGDVLTVHTGYIGTSCVVPGKYDNCLTFTTLITTTDASALQGEFLAQYLNSEIGMSAVQAVTTQGGRQNLNTNDFVKVEIRYPSVVEQSRICKMLRDIDNLITLHQRKYDKLVNVKKSMLEKMFPRDGASVPEIRFAGFTDAWEQRKFGDQYQKITEKNDLSFGADRIISVANMYFKSDVKQSEDDYMRTYNIMRLGDIAFEGNKSKHFAHGRFVENTIGDGIVSHVFDVFRPIADYDLSFWKYLINNEGVMGRIMTRCTKASTMMTNLVADDFLAESILVPSIQEQQEIGMFLDKLDSLITLHQCKLEKLKNIKKSMLEKMFV